MELPQNLYRFDDVLLDVSNLRLTVSGEVRPLEPKSFRLLQFLIESRDRVVPKEEILSVVWEGVAVSDNALTRAVAQIRKALNDDPKQPRYIETVPTIGYRFAGQLIEKAVPPAVPAPARRRFSSRLIAMGLSAILVVLAGGVWLARRSSQSPGRVVAIRQITKSAGADLWPSFSPDGSQIAFSSNRSGQYEIYARSLAPDGAEREVTSDGQENIQPAWSPDGRYLAYVPRLHGGIKIIPVSGGPARYLTDTGDSPQWSPNGRSLVIREFNPNVNPAIETVPADSGAILALIPADGGPASPLTKKEAAPFNPTSPGWLRDGRHVVFGSRPPGSSRSDVWIVDSESRELHAISVGTFPQFPVFSPDGRDLYFADRDAKVPGLWRARTGRAWKIESEEALIPSEGANPRDITISADGSRIAFSRQNGESAIWSVPVDSQGSAASEPSPLIQDRSVRNINPFFSADGSRISWNSRQDGSREVIYVANADGSSPVAVTPADQDSIGNQWVGKELKLAYQARRNGELGYWVAPLQGRPERLDIASELQHADRWRLSSDGTMLAAHVRTPKGLRVMVTGLRSHSLRTLTPVTRNIGFPCWSPDGRWIAAEEQMQGRTSLVVLPSVGGEIRTLGREFTQYFVNDWSPDSDRILFAGLRNGVWNIYWISVSTRKVEQLTHFTAQSGFVRYPSWSPKGDRIVFERNNLTSNIYIVELSAPNQ
jgi:Tol biopolymer transport system component/DNA-binding winged helix-turn-helix (wHTH) protein